jgi:aspartate racemase
MTMHVLFEEQAHKTPEALALTDGKENLTYQQLNCMANQIAHFLVHKGIRPETWVGVCLGRSTRLIAALLGVMKAGGAYLPLDPAYPAEQLSFMLSDAGTPVLLTENRYREMLLADPSNSQRLVLCLEDIWEEIEQQPAEDLHLPVGPENLVYMIYTSGSSGRPKGVQIEHRALVNYIWFARHFYDIQPRDRALQFASINFDASAEEIYPTLISGAALVLRTTNMLNSIPSFLRQVADMKVTVINLPTAFWHEMVNYLESEAERLPERVRLVIIGGEKARVNQVQAWFRCMGSKVRLVNSYGPTETTIVAILGDLQPGDPLLVPGREVSVGRPVANTQVYILDESMQPMGPDTAGELFIGGAGLARGYLNRPEITQARFIPDPFSPDPSARLYRTGDIARCRPDGEIEIIGRSDDQVKIRGYRVELGEIETTLLQMPGIRSTVVTVADDQCGTRQVIAYYVPEAGEEPTTAAILSYLRARLPHFMLPSALVRLEAIPITPGGKVDRRQLPAPDWGARAAGQDRDTPTNPIEQKLADIWADALDLPGIGIHDSFFEVGGHSLLALRIMTQVEKQFGQSLPLAILYQAPTIADLARLLEKGTQGEKWSSLVPIHPQGSKPIFYLVHPVGGDVVHYNQLVRYYNDPDQPFWGLRAQGLDGHTQPLRRLEDMAAHYIQEIQQMQPHGPYYLGGHSFGALAAFEMARQLHQAGEEVGLLALLDMEVTSNIPPEFPGLPPHLRYMGANLSVATRGKARGTENISLYDSSLPPVLQKLYLLAQRGFFIGRKLFFLPWSKKGVYLQRLGEDLRQADAGTGPEIPQAYIEVRRACEIATRDYALRTYPGQLALFMQEGPNAYLVNPILIWSKAALGGIQVYKVPGTHLSMIEEPHVQVLAQALRQCMQAHLSVRE